jgi:hypothetical protein
MKKRHTLRISVSLTAPYLVHGNDPGKFGLDAVLMRDHANRFILPGTLLVGRIRDAWREIAAYGGRALASPHEPPVPLAAAQSAALWFGIAHESGRTAYETVGRIIDADLILTKINDHAVAYPFEPADIANRIKQDESTGAVASGMLAFVEQLARAGADLSFAGTWTVYATDDEIATLPRSLLAGLQWQNQLGAGRSVGFGRLRNANVELVDSPQSATTGKPTIARHGAIRLAIKILEPICVDSNQFRGNLFESNDVIPGRVLKGAMARLLMYKYDVNRLADAQQSALCRDFNELRITHALPARDGTRRPAPIPLSLVSAGGRVYDAVTCSEPAVDGRGNAPTFSTDWKGEFDEVDSARNWGGLNTDGMATHLRVRTAIDSSTRRAAENDLFAYEMKVAKNTTLWLADLYVPEKTDRTAILDELETILRDGLDFIGKTKAHASLQWRQEAESVWQDTNAHAPRNGRWILTLVTPACLFTAKQASETKSLLELYGELFKELSKGRLDLLHFFASQSLAGGEYLHRRFHPDDKYRSYILTDAGSVFVFAAPDPKRAQECLDSWAKSGLGVPQAVKAQFGDTWDCNPYIPQNGYGEIAVNLQVAFPAFLKGQA